QSRLFACAPGQKPNNRPGTHLRGIAVKKQTGTTLGPAEKSAGLFLCRALDHHLGCRVSITLVILSEAGAPRGGTTAKSKDPEDASSARPHQGVLSNTFLNIGEPSAP